MKLQCIVVTNDDGIDAPGLKVAEALAAELAEQVWVFAPASDQSGMAQALSMHHPLRVVAHGARRYSVSGTPADCVMTALGGTFMAGLKPDLIISGVNWGMNLSDSVMYSGTVGAAVAAAHFDTPAIALSQAFSDRNDWDFRSSETWAKAVVEKLWLARDTFGFAWNINFPAGAADRVDGLRFTRQASGAMVAPRLIERVDSEGNAEHWIGFERSFDGIDDAVSDVRAVNEGYVSAMPLKRERCDEARLADIGAGRQWTLDRQTGIR